MLKIENLGERDLEVDRLDEEPEQVTGEWLNTHTLPPGASVETVVSAVAPVTFELAWYQDGEDLPETITVQYRFE